MATLILGTLGSTLGGAFLPSIGPLSGAVIGRAAGAIAGRYIDQSLFAASGQPRVLEGPRLKDLEVTTSTEGKPIIRAYGRVRVAGEMIWATKFEEDVITRRQSSGGSSGGKGGGSSSGSTVTSKEYRYYANFAIALAEGPINRIGRVWANGNDLNLADFNHRIYKGNETQTPDSLIEAKEGTGNAPAYRGLAYIVFERMPLARFGNRIPQFNFEIHRQLDDFEQSIAAIGLIPSSGEYVYEPSELTRDLTFGVTQPKNTHTHQGESDWHVSLDHLQEDIPNAKNVSLFVSWFGTDLRAEQCELRPGVDNRDKKIIGRTWSVSNETRSTAHLISLNEGRSAYGGTPSDETIVNAITDLKARGLKVTFNPFILMDIKASNALPDPYSTNPNQPHYPWRGRITVNPASGLPGTPDKTATANAQLQSLIGTATPQDFSVNGTTVTYTGPAEWSLRRMLLHYAHLCASAGGVDSFILCSELRGLTTIRDENNTYPFVNALEAIAADIKSIMGGNTKLTYGADWSEYFGHQPSDGTNDVYFHLDPLWSSSNIDAVGIDCYWPLSDWRQGSQHEDASTASSLYERDYLQSNIEGGEGYDWYYANEEDRTNQIRSAITDGAGKPWVFRYKDIQSWWKNQHYNRPGGVESTTPTNWLPESKPIWFIEAGCPAVHFGSNQPNLFVDPKSAESAVPYFSDGSRDDYIQRRYIDAIINYFTPGGEGFGEENNPISSVYSDRMLDPERIYIYTWDARPYPAFPANTDIWGDGDNWLRGHWLNGRTGSLSLSALVAQIMEDYQFTEYSVPNLNGIVEGYMIDRVMSAREALQPLELAFFFDSFASEGTIKFKHRGTGTTNLTLTPDDLVEPAPDKPLYEVTRKQETELPRSAKINFIDGNHSYKTRTLEGQQTLGKTKRVATATLPIVMETNKVQSLANKWVQESWAAREQGSFALPPSLMALEPTDIINLNTGISQTKLRISEIKDETARHCEAISIDPTLYEDTIATTSLPENPLPDIYGPTSALFLDLPLLGGNETEHTAHLGAFQDPWPGEVAFYRSSEDDNYTLNQTVNAPAITGRLLTNLNSGPIGRWDYANDISIELDSGSLSSVSDISVLGGNNLAAIQHDNGLWEVIQFQTSTLIAEQQYSLTKLLRAQAGTEDAMAMTASQGARFVLIDEALAEVNMSLNEINLEQFWRYGPAPYVIGHPAYQTEQITFTGRGLRPLRPVHIKGVAQGGDLIITWIRQSRIGGDMWEPEEIPLSETTEAYDIEILNNNTPVRTAMTNSPSYTYTADDQISDWGSAQSTYHVRVYQRSETYGRGGAGEATLSNQ